MATYSKQLLSGSTNGKQVKVVATSTPGTTVHTAVSGTTNFDEVWIYAVNIDTADRILTIEYGEATAPDGNIIVTVPFKAGLLLVIPGLVLQNSLVIKAFAATANVIMISGFVNRITT